MFVLVTFATVRGKLKPGVPGIKLKQSSEAAGSNNFPLLAYINIVTVVVATVLYTILFVPAIGIQEMVYNYVVCGSQIVFIWFCNWVRNLLACFACGYIIITDQTGHCCCAVHLHNPNGSYPTGICLFASMAKLGILVPSVPACDSSHDCYS